VHHSVELVDIHVRFGNTEILQGVNVEAKPWEFVSIVGANGAGKTTLLKVVNGILTPSAGRVHVLGQDLHHCDKVSALRKDIAVVPQKINSIRFPIRVEEAVMMGRYGKIGLFRKPKPGDWKKTHEAIEAVGMRRFSKKLVNELSGGEQQKVALARALAQDPLILLLDEPTTYLDSDSRAEIMEIIHSVHHQKGLTTLLVSHDLSLVEQYSDKIYLLEGGKSYLNKGKV
jgi:ABC-type cobalamin/Fe3+-siderophores transport system ATPase subunit